MDDLRDMVLVVTAVLTGLLVLYTVVRLAVRDGVLDARAKDDAELAEREIGTTLRRGRTSHRDDNGLDDLLDSGSST